MKVLIVRTGAFGDVLHALPAVAALREARPTWKIHWAVEPQWAPLLAGASGHGPVVDEAPLVWAREWVRRPFAWSTVRSILQLRRRLRAARYDAVVDMQGTLRSAVIGWMAGARTFAGYNDPRETPARWLYSRGVQRAGTHVVEQGAALLGAALGLELTPAAVVLPQGMPAELWAEHRTQRPMAVLSAGAGWGAKRWPAERFGALAAGLRDGGFHVVINASREDDPLALRAVEASRGAARMIVCSVAELAALLRRADVFIGGDSGPLHLAAALEVPLVALFGPTDPARNGPWGAGRSVMLRDAASVTSYKRSAETDAGLARITVAEVLAAVERVREKTAPGGDSLPG